MRVPRSNSGHGSSWHRCLWEPVKQQAVIAAEEGLQKLRGDVQHIRCTSVDRGSIPGRTWTSSLLHLQTGSGANPASLQCVPAALTLGVKRPGREADHPPSSSANIKNTLSSTSAPPYVFMAWCLAEHRDNFTFTLPSSDRILFVLSHFSQMSIRI